MGFHTGIRVSWPTPCFHVFIPRYIVADFGMKHVQYVGRIWLRNDLFQPLSQVGRLQRGANERPSHSRQRPKRRHRLRLRHDHGRHWTSAKHTHHNTVDGSRVECAPVGVAYSDSSLVVRILSFLRWCWSTAHCHCERIQYQPAISIRSHVSMLTRVPKGLGPSAKPRGSESETTPGSHGKHIHILLFFLASS